MFSWFKKKKKEEVKVIVEQVRPNIVPPTQKKHNPPSGKVDMRQTQAYMVGPSRTEDPISVRPTYFDTPIVNEFNIDIEPRKIPDSPSPSSFSSPSYDSYSSDSSSYDSGCSDGGGGGCD